MAFATARLSIRPMRTDDRDLFVALYTDPQVTREIAAPLPMERALAHFAAALASDGNGPVWSLHTLQHAADGAKLGLLGARRRGDTVELGAMLLPEWQRRGFCGEAIAGFVPRIFEWVDVDRIFLTHAPGHAAMRKTIARLHLFHETTDECEMPTRWQLTRAQWRHTCTSP